MTTPTTRRRWFHFGVGAVFIAMAIFAGWLFWELQFIRARREATVWLLNNGGFCIPEELLSHASFSSIPIWRVMLGDEAIGVVEFGRDTPRMELDRFRALFPEGRVQQTDFVPLGS